MRRPLVAGNWKMNGSSTQIDHLLNTLVPEAQSLTQVEVAVFPPFVYLSRVGQHLSGSAIALGAQNLSIHSDGAYTGEVSANMLLDSGCHYVIVGHSERRALFGETNEIVAQKFLLAAKQGLTPILCVGETRQEYEANLTHRVIREQLEAVLECAGVQSFAKAVIAYEPVWAIGTGLTPSAEQAQDIHKAIREQLAERDNLISQGVRILYGGSVKADNVLPFFKMPDIDGALVGGASLDAHSFLKICQQAVR